MTTLHAMVLLVAAQRLVELAWARRNTRRLMRAGAVEHGARHYPLFVALHAAWLGALLLAVPADRPPFAPLLALYLALMAARLWVMVSLGGQWTTRVVTLHEAPLVRHGPYRFLRHPNYVVVTAEIALLPMAFGAWGVALAFTLLNAALLVTRVRVEERALAGRPLGEPARR